MQSTLPLRASRALLSICSLQCLSRVQGAGKPQWLPRASLACLHTASPEIASAPHNESKKPACAGKDGGQHTFHATHARHILRGILRECTYFPDPEAADWIRRHALKSYAEYSFRVWKHRDDAGYEERLEIVRRKARQAMYQLQRANEGDRKMLMKALYMAYGRVGKRRRELMAPLLSVGAEKQDTAQVKLAGTPAIPKPDPTSTDNPVKAQTRAFIHALPPQLHALISSQIASSPPEHTRRNPKRLSIAIPETNTWHKPMPQSRVRNKIKAWYANTLDTLLPPLPDAEWERLRDLSTGALRMGPVKPRRKKLEPEPTALEMVVLKGKVPASVLRKGGLLRKKWSRRMSSRYMREAWRDVFQQCSRMDYDGQEDKWKVTWGHHELASMLRPTTSVGLETAVLEILSEDLGKDDEGVVERMPHAVSEE